MIHITILALKKAVPASIADARYVFGMVNLFLQQSGRSPAFEIQVAAVTKEVPLQDGLFMIYPDVQLHELQHTDLVIIPSLTGDMLSATHANKAYAEWIVKQYKQGSEVASFCSGAFLLAFTGLLKGKQCTTHWMYANEFRYFNPLVTLVDEKVITDQNGLYSSGGSNAYWNLLLHLVEKYTNREMAIHTAKYFVIDIDRNIQSPFIIFHGLKDHDDELIRNAQEYIEQHYPDRLTVDQIAATFNTSRRTFERRFKKTTRNTVAEYIQRVKIEAAKKQLETGRKSIMEVMLEVGYADNQAFRDVFKRVTGMTPVGYRDKYNVSI